MSTLTIALLCATLFGTVASISSGRERPGSWMGKFYTIGKRGFKNSGFTHGFGKRLSYGPSGTYSLDNYNQGNYNYLMPSVEWNPQEFGRKRTFPASEKFTYGFDKRDNPEDIDLVDVDAFQPAEEDSDPTNNRWYIVERKRRDTTNIHKRNFRKTGFGVGFGKRMMPRKNGRYLLGMKHPAGVWTGGIRSIRAFLPQLNRIPYYTLNRLRQNNDDKRKSALPDQPFQRRFWKRNHGSKTLTSDNSKRTGNIFDDEVASQYNANYNKRGRIQAFELQSSPPTSAKRNSQRKRQDEVNEEKRSFKNKNFGVGFGRK